MKHTLIFTFTLTLAIFLTACGGSNNAPVANQASDTVDNAAAAAAAKTSALSEDYADALPIRNQLTLGILRLEDDSALAITPEQAANLLPLWQALNSLTQSGTGAQVEIDALLSQIEGELTDTQLKAIAAMHLSREDTQKIAQEWGISGGEGGSGDGAGRNMSEDERATRRAERGITNENKSSGVSAALLDRLVQLLQERAK